ncbi:MAG TPA: nicotinamide riboside transporter PnuC [Bacteroidales bacterium]|nr:nicotinamide riboside transporter PnuC [Bacteroidales bacterium]
MNWITENYIELTAAILGIAGVYLTTRQNILCWPVGLVNVILSMYVFFTEKLYADVVLQIFYVAMTLYGWYNWIFGGQKKFELQVRKIRPKEFVIMFVAGFCLAFVTAYLFATYTDAAYPYWDSMLTVWGIIATYAMGKKIIDHWTMWIVIDINCTVLYFIKELYAFAPLYFIFTLLAVYGYFTWKKDLKKQAAI